MGVISVILMKMNVEEDLFNIGEDSIFLHTKMMKDDRTIKSNEQAIIQPPGAAPGFNQYDC